MASGPFCATARVLLQGTLHRVRRKVSDFWTSFAVVSTYAMQTPLGSPCIRSQNRSGGIGDWDTKRPANCRPRHHPTAVQLTPRVLAPRSTRYSRALLSV